MFPFTLFCVLCVYANLFQESLAFTADYYWREYTGIIPHDAIIGGKDVNGHNIYMGQAYVNEVGLVVAPIYPGKKEVYFHLAYKPYTISDNVKILCGRQENFYWAPTTSKNMHLFLIDKHGVKGGHGPHGIYNIGRTSRGGETKIGRIHSNEQEPDLDISHNGKEYPGIANFEILLYKENLFDERTTT